ncbi:MAG: response regulator, partial [Planctomycetes bacterium]|nr:response regulator [Planctomycetota bacterium]
YRLRGAARDHRWIQERAKPLYHKDQTFAGYIGSCTDITEIKLVEENLQRHRDHLNRQLHFAGTLNRMTQAITGLDGSHGILDALARILGEALAIERCLIVEVSLARRLALRCAEWRSPACPPAGQAASDFHIDVFPETLRHLWEMRAALESHADHPNPRFASEGSATLLHQRQGIRSLLWYPFGFRADGFSLFMLDHFSEQRAWGTDERHFLEAVANQVNLALQKIRIVAARAEAEEALRRSLQMEAMSRLAGGVANDFNNQLTAISGHAGLLRDGLAGHDPLRRHVDAIRTASERASTTTRQLLAFSRSQVTQLADVDPTTLLDILGRTLRPLLGEDVALVIAAEPGPGMRADARQLESALINVAINAREAMPTGGTVSISTSTATLDRETAQRHGVASGTFVCIQVADTGVGMDQATLASVFEPYFSTKQPGGTGFGLSSAHGQVAAMGGFITLVSCPGRGTTVSIWLPSAGLGTVEKAGHRPTTLLPISGGGSETVLVVEDEPAVLDLVRDTLHHAGYHVLAAQHAQEAERLAAQHRGDIHLLLTDVAMPKTSGTALASQLAATRPTMRIIFMSGYAADAFAIGREISRAGFLAKPFTIDELMRAVRVALDVVVG